MEYPNDPFLLLFFLKFFYFLVFSEKGVDEMGWDEV